MKVYVTQYALSAGIQEYDNAEECHPSSTGMIDIRGPHNTFYVHGEGRNWHRTKEEAIACVKEMRIKKIASLHKQIARLENLDVTRVKVMPSGRRE